MTDTAARTLDHDVVKPFQLDIPNLRGRLVRLGSVLDEVLEQHAYPQPVALLVAEMATLAALLASMLKYDGVFTLQTRGDGPVSMLVADVTSTGDIRACASFDHERLDAHGNGEEAPSLIGEGYLAFTVDQGDDTERYQGIVELRPDGLADSVRHYFRQSEQLTTGLRVMVEERDDGWSGAAVSLQRMPEDPAMTIGSAAEDDWRRAMLLLSTATRQELLDQSHSLDALLFRLFHEETVRVYQPQMLRHACRCSRDRVERVLRSIGRDDVNDLRLTEGPYAGHVEVRCEFCGTRYRFDDDDLSQL